MIRLGLALLLSLRFVAGVASGQEARPAPPRLQSATVVLALSPAEATIDATYRVLTTSAPIVLNGLRLPEQSVTIEEFSGGDPASAEEQAGLYKIAAGSGPEALTLLRLRYRLSGDLRRLPLFVPEAAVVPGASDIRVTIVGAPPGVERELFPRSTRQADGSLLARPTNLPALVVIPEPGRLSVHRASTWTVILLIVGSALYWLGRNRWRRGRGEA